MKKLLGSKDQQDLRKEALNLLSELEAIPQTYREHTDFSKHRTHLFKIFYSLKGAATLAGWTELAKHLHKIETIFVSSEKENLTSHTLTDLLLNEVTTIRAEIQKIEIDAATDHPNEFSIKEKTVGKALIVDDEEDIVDLIQSLLQGAGFETFGTTSPLAALARLESYDPDVVLSDISMPIMNGLEFQVKTKELHPDVPFIFISGQIDKELLFKAIENGVHSIFNKPFQTPLLIQSCQIAARRSQTAKQIQKSILLLVSQLSNLDEALTGTKTSELKQVIGDELASLLLHRRNLIGRKKSAA